MKASGVSQGFKWLADKLHPQLPLTSKESQRLLTALNSSFRRHLDEAHPSGAEHDPKKRPSNTNGFTKSNTGTTRPSAHSYADRHLASVLTSPLFVRNQNGPSALGYTTAKATLAKNPQKDPVQLLEEYQVKNAASVRIAELCLETLYQRLATLSPEIKRARIGQDQAGRRVLLWLFNTKFHTSESFADDLRFIHLLVYFLISEGRVQSLWDWIKLDISLEVGVARSQELTVHRQMRAKYRWKGHLLRSMLDVTMGNANKDGKIGSIERLHDALDMYGKACDLRRTAESSNDHFHWLLLTASSTLRSQLTWRCRPREGIDAAKFEKFVDSFRLSVRGSPMYQEVNMARLELCHPTQPSADRALWVLHRIFTAEPDIAAKPILSRITTRDSKERHDWYLFMVRTIHILQESRQDDEAAWLKSKIHDIYPELAPHIEKNLQSHATGLRNVSTAQEPTEPIRQFRVPFPGFT